MSAAANLNEEKTNSSTAAKSRPWLSLPITTTDGSHTSLAIDDQGQAHLVYWDNRQTEKRQLVYAQRTGQGWQMENLVATQGDQVAIALTSDGSPLIAYFDFEVPLATQPSSAAPQLRLARRVNGGWEMESVTTQSADFLASFASGDLCLALAADDQPVITYFDNDALKLARRQGSDWEITTIATGHGAGFFHDLALDDQGQPVIAYHHLGRQQLRLIHWIEGTMQDDLIDETPNSGEYVSLVLDENNQPQLCCWQAAGLAYFTRANNSEEGPAGAENETGPAWRLESVEAAQGHQGLGLYCQLTLDGQGVPLVAYYDGHEGDIKFARRNPDGNWSGTLVDDGGGPEGDAGGYIALALDQQDRVQIAFYDWSTQSLKFAFEKSDRPGCAVWFMIIWNWLGPLLGRNKAAGR